MGELSAKAFNWFNEEGKKKATCPYCGKHPNPYSQGSNGQHYCPECFSKHKLGMWAD